jgi:hypothetical protein
LEISAAGWDPLFRRLGKRELSRAMFHHHFDLGFWRVSSTTVVRLPPPRTIATWRALACCCRNGSTQPILSYQLSMITGVFPPRRGRPLAAHGNPVGLIRYQT